jgi:hypothetical protein
VAAGAVARLVLFARVAATAADFLNSAAASRR